MAVNKEQLAEMMGEKNIVKPAQQQYPIIRMNGNKNMKDILWAHPKMVLKIS